jgi:hypothetical protein
MCIRAVTEYIIDIIPATLFLNFHGSTSLRRLPFLRTYCFLSHVATVSEHAQLEA